MSATDIYKVKDLPEPKPEKRRRRSKRTFSEATEVVADHHKRRSRNSGVRRFRHQMKKPEYSRRFWFFTIAVLAAAVLTVFIWDMFFRYPKEPAPIPGATSNPYPRIPHYD